MRRKDNARLETLQRVVNTLKEHQTIVHAFKPLKTLFTELDTLTKQIANERADAWTNSEGTTNEKKQAFEAMVKQSVSLAKLALIWAKLNNDQLLMPEFDLEVSDFRNGNILDAIDKASRLESLLRTYVEDLEDYSITVEQLDQLKMDIASLQTLNPKPLQIRGKNKVKREQLSEDLRQAMELARDIENLVVGKYMDSEPQFVNLYLAAMRIYDPATRSTQVELVVLDQAGNPIPQAECDILELEGEEQWTNQTGLALIEGIRSGTFTLEIRKEGYESYRGPVEVKRGKKTSLNLKLANNS